MNAKKKTLIVALAVVAPLVLISGLYYTHLTTPPPVPKTFEQAVKTMGSGRYQRLPDYRKAEYAGQARRLLAELPPERREQVRKEMAEDETLGPIAREMGRGAEIDLYKALSRAPRAVRVKMLDAEIQRHEAARAARQERSRQSATQRQAQDEAARAARQERSRQSATQRQAQDGRQGPTRTATQVFRGMVQQDNPQTGSFGLRAEYSKAMRERRKELGLPEY
jgi:hypothetical protein